MKELMGEDSSARLSELKASALIGIIFLSLLINAPQLIGNSLRGNASSGVPPLFPSDASNCLKCSSESVSPSPISGVQSMAVILVRFPDKANSRTSDYIHYMVFATMNSYFNEVSYGLLRFSGTTYGWYDLSKTMVYYGAGERSEELVIDSINVADPYINYRDYTFVLIVHAGNDEAQSRDTNDITSFAYVEPKSFPNDGGVSLRVGCVAELDPVGVYAHEIGHTLGLPDLYHYSVAPDDFVGPWDLMAMGSWNGPPGKPGESPAHPTTWCKIKLGWLPGSRILTVERGQFKVVTIDPHEIPSVRTQAVKIPLPDGTYYLVEVRQKTGFDNYLPSVGVLITRIDERLGSGEGIVKVIDANSLTYSLDDATFDVRQTFDDKANHVRVSVLSTEDSSYRVMVEYESPDLAVAVISLSPEIPVIGNNVTFYVEVKNRGTADADFHHLYAYINGELARSFYLRLKVGESKTFSFHWVALIAGPHSIEWKIDPTNLILESNETNNSLSVTFIVKVVLTVESPFPGISVWIDGIEHKTSLKGDVRSILPPGTLLVEIQTPVPVRPGTREVFARWSDGVTLSRRSVEIRSNLTLTAYYKTQHQVTFSFRNYTGLREIVPIRVVATNPAGLNETFTVYVNVWMDEGKWTVKEIFWQGIDVRPDEPSLDLRYPRTWSINCRVFDIKIKVVDAFNLPIPKTQVITTLPNGTSVETKTDDQGFSLIGMIPGGKYKVKAYHFGLWTHLETDTSLTTTPLIRMILSIPVIAVMVMISATVVIILVKKRRAKVAQLTSSRL